MSYTSNSGPLHTEIFLDSLNLFTIFLSVDVESSLEVCMEEFVLY